MVHQISEFCITSKSLNTRRVCFPNRCFECRCLAVCLMWHSLQIQWLFSLYSIISTGKLSKQSITTQARRLDKATKSLTFHTFIVYNFCHKEVKNNELPKCTSSIQSQRASPRRWSRIWTISAREPLSTSSTAIFDKSLPSTSSVSATTVLPALWSSSTCLHRAAENCLCLRWEAKTWQRCCGMFPLGTLCGLLVLLLAWWLGTF